MVRLSDALSATAGPLLRVEGLELGYRWKRLVRGLTWEHRAGRVAWVIGDNGAGKSSLLRVLAGRSRPAAGRVLRIAPGGRERAVLYYHPAMGLPPEALVGDWDQLVARLTDLDSRRPAAAGLTPTVPTRQRLERLSTGEAKRLLLATLLRLDAPFILLDEPFEHLSPAARDALTRELADRARDSVVIVATNQVIPAGAADGPALRLDDPVQRFTASETVP